jgi:predicted nuclease of restriction endonuclease-like (RecB) superfamily
VNSILVATYWEIGRQILEFEQRGEERAKYGSRLLKELSRDLTRRFGRGFSADNLELMRRFYREFPISETVSRKSDSSRAQPGSGSVAGLPLSWSHYVELLSIDDSVLRRFYERECVTSRWTIRQLRRHIDSALFDRSLTSRDPGNRLQPKANEYGRIIRDPYVLEFLGSPMPRSESDLEDALIDHMTDFLLELGCGFTFVARQKRLRAGPESFFLDMLFYHRSLRCLVAIDLKLGKFTPECAGQMNLYLNCLKEQDMIQGESPPIGILLCSEKDDSVAKFALGGLANHVFASTDRLSLPSPSLLTREIQAERRRLEAHTSPSRSLPLRENPSSAAGTRRIGRKPSHFPPS